MIKNLLKKFCHVTGIPPYFLRNNYLEFKMMLIRLNTFLPLQKRKLKQIKKQPEIKLNFGCGVTKYPGWTGIDSFFAKHVDLVLDLRRRLPFSDNSVDYCYSEHFFEHLYPDEGIRHLQEIQRILKPGGTYRIVVPAAIRFVEKYLNNDNEFFKLAFPWEQRPINAIYNIVNWGGEHRSIFDFPHLEYLGKKCGFARIRECSANSSPINTLKIDKADPQRVAESLYVELYKASTEHA